MESLKQAWAQLQTKFEALSTREQRMVLALIPVFVIVLFFILIITFDNSARSIRSRTEAKRDQLEQVRALAGNYSQAQAQRRAAEQQLSASNVRLLSLLEQRATQAGLTIPTMNPRGEAPVGDGRVLESRVDLTLADITVRELVDFLSAVERGPGVVQTTYLRIEPRPQAENLTANVNVSAYRLDQQAAEPTTSP
ncbi:MAG TPA: type II secretion system protein GspM [Myxococcaceae bacterium]|nr:type II secretion system protein GspM [Myxococcaceae bacterium]